MMTYRMSLAGHVGVITRARLLGMARTALSCCFAYAAHSGLADVAQLVERNLAKVEVAGSIPVVRSRNPRFGGGFFASAMSESPVFGRLAHRWVR